MSKHLKLPTMLVIADNPSVRLWIKKHLNDQFFILEANKKSGALEAIRYSALDFIVLDASFEDCDALELCREIRPLLQSTLTPILLVTGRLKRSYREAALDAGVTDFLSDQLDLEELETRIATGRKAVQVREKTVDISSALQQQKRGHSENYLKNKWVLSKEALGLIARAKKENVPMALLLLRIDNFHEIEAKEILSPLSDLLQRHLRGDDLLIPSSEGRFIVLLHNMTGESAKSFSETLRNSVQRHRFQTKKGEVSLTISIAFSPIEANETAFKKMVDAAIQSLSQAQFTKNAIISIAKEIL